MQNQSPFSWNLTPWDSHTYIDTYIHTHIYIYIYIHTHTHTHRVFKGGGDPHMYIDVVWFFYPVLFKWCYNQEEAYFSTCITILLVIFPLLFSFWFFLASFWSLPSCLVCANVLEALHGMSDLSLDVFFHAENEQHVYVFSCLWTTWILLSSVKQMGVLIRHKAVHWKTAY